MIGGLRDQGKGLGDVEVDMLGELNGSINRRHDGDITV